MKPFTFETKPNVLFEAGAAKKIAAKRLRTFRLAYFGQTQTEGT
jgi:hypothetical protein